MPDDAPSTHPTPPKPDDRLADLLDEAVALDVAARERFLADLALRDAALARELRELIAVLPDPELRAAPEKVERGEGDPFVGEPEVGDTIGGCILEKVLGRGGIGTVFSARQQEPAREVAVKVLRLAGARASHLRRFRNEALALGRLVHPALARIYASGTERLRGSELPYIVMERIDGAQGFVEWARAPRRTSEEIVRALATVCDGMQHGHNRGVIHRDLKPTNVLVGSNGQPHVIDFGVARLVGADESSATETIAGSLIGTPAYMAPEQFTLAPADIDSRIDVHALGVILYESITGRRPYDIPRHLYFDAARILRDTTPAAPHLVDSTIPADLSAIAMKAMAKDRDRRYVSMSAFAEDLRAYLEGSAVRARPESAAGRLARAMRRYPGWTAGIVATAVFLVAATIVSMVAWRVVRGERDAARRDRDRARTELATIDAERGLIPFEGGARTDLAAIKPPLVAGMIGRELDDTVRSSVEFTGGNMMTGAMHPDRTRWLASGDANLCGIFDLRTGAPPAVARVDPSPILAVGWSLASGEALVCDASGRLLEISPDREPRVLLEANLRLRAIIPAADRDRILLLAADRVGVFRLSTGVAAWTAPTSGTSLGALSWDGTGTAYAVLGDRTAAAYEVPPDGAPRRIQGFAPASSDARSIAVSPDGRTVALGTDFTGVLVVDAATGGTVARLPIRHAVWSVAFSVDGTRLYAGDRAGRLNCFRTADWSSESVQVADSGEPLWALGEALDGTIVANVGSKVAFFAADRRWSAVPEPHAGRLFAVVLMPPHTVRAVGSDGSIRDLDLALGTWSQPLRVIEGDIHNAAMSPDGTRAAAIVGEELRILDIATGAVARATIPPRLSTVVGRIAWNPDGTLLACAVQGHVGVYRPDGTLVAERGTSPSESIRLCWYGPDRFVKIIGAVTRLDCIVRDGIISGESAPVATVAQIARSGGRWVITRFHGAVSVSHPGGLEQLAAQQEDAEFTLERHRDHANCGAISPDGKIIATGGADGTVRLWSMETGDPLTIFSSHEQQVVAVLWLPDGSGLVSIGPFGEVRLLDSVPRADRIAAAQRSTANPRPAYGQ